MINALTHLSLFTGIGGIDLAAEWAGFRTVAQVERDPFCQQVLAKHWPDVPRYDDVRAVTGDALRDAGIGRPALVSGGFPCQPFSVAGQRRGAEDDRFLWPEMCRIVSELRPDWVLGENVSGFVNMALDDVLADLERIGYTCRAFAVPAAGVGAPHQRERCFIVAHASGVSGGETVAAPVPLGEDTGSWDHAPCCGVRQSCSRAIADVADPHFCVGEPERQGGRMGGIAQPLSWEKRKMPSPVIESGVCGMADGVPGRVERLRALGNAVVPQQVYPILRGIAMIETGVRA